MVGGVRTKATGVEVRVRTTCQSRFSPPLWKQLRAGQWHLPFLRLLIQQTPVIHGDQDGAGTSCWVGVGVGLTLSNPGLQLLHARCFSGWRRSTWLCAGSIYGPRGSLNAWDAVGGGDSHSGTSAYWLDKALPAPEACARRDSRCGLLILKCERATQGPTRENAVITCCMLLSPLPQ